jgi:hypothetical protein
MTERATLDELEHEIARALERLVAPAVDHRPASEVADVAMRPRGLGLRARDGSRPRRLLALGLAAAFLLPVAYLGIVGLQPTDPDPTEDVAIFLRREEGSAPGVAVVAVRPDGDETVVRRLPDSIAPEGTLGAWGTVSRSGWLALSVDNYGGPWPMILVDLGDATAEPWVINEADLGGVGPRWGPTGLIAADSGRQSSMIIADPETRELTRTRRAMVGGGPSIVWSADGSGLVGPAAGDAYQVIPLDGGAPTPVTEVFDPRGTFGPKMATLRICLPDSECLATDDGRVERVESDGSARTIWRQDGDDRALAARFGDAADEYWLSVDHDGGRQVAVVHADATSPVTVATVNRASDWQAIGTPDVAPDGSMVVLWVYQDPEESAVIVPGDGDPATFHAGNFAGFVDGLAATAFVDHMWAPATTTLPLIGEAWKLPSVDELIDAELERNPGRHVLGKASHEAIEGDTQVRDVEIPWEGDTGEVYLDCFGPSAATLNAGGRSMTSPCLTPGSYISLVQRGETLRVGASGDTAWRIVVYSSG